MSLFRHSSIALLPYCVVLLIFSAEAQTARTWTGATSTQWSNPNNWTPVGTPANGDSLTFPSGAANLTNTNDLMSLSVGGVTVGATTYTLNGNGLIAAQPGSVLGGSLGVWNMPITVQGTNITLGLLTAGGGIAINASGTKLRRALTTAPLNLGSFGATFDKVWIVGGISGNGPINIDAPSASYPDDISYAVFRTSGNYQGTISTTTGTEQDVYFDGASLPLATVSLPQGTIFGNGTVGNVTVKYVQAGQVIPAVNRGSSYQSGWHMWDGLSTLNTGSLTLTGGGGAAFSITGPTPGSEHTRVNVTGTVTIGASTRLNVFVSDTFTPLAGQQFILVNNDGNDSINGIFDNLPEGATLTPAYGTPNGPKFSISYHGGDGNDIVLTVLPTAAALPTTVTIVPSANPASISSPLTLTITVTGSGPIPTGTVNVTAYSIYGRPLNLGLAILNGGQASITLDPFYLISNLGGTWFSVFATYSGDANYPTNAGSLDTLRLVAPGTIPTVTLTSSQNPTIAGQGTTFTATITGSGPTPTGSVIFLDGNVILGNVPLNNGVATLTTSALAIGNHTIFISYGGDQNYIDVYVSMPSAQVVSSPGVAISLLPGTLPNGAAGAVYPTTVFSAVGGIPAYTYRVSSGTLPTGLGLSSTGILSGTPTAGGTFNFTVTVTDAASVTGSQSYSVAISAPAIQSQSISFGNPGTRPFGAVVVLMATSTSSLPVSYASTTPSVCSVSGSQVTPVFVGTCTIVASQAGNANYSPASSITQSFTIAPGTQSIDFPPIADTMLGTGPIAVSTSASSGLPVTLTAQTPAVCTVSNGSIALLTVGTCTIVASQPGNATYAAAIDVARSFSIGASNLLPQILVFPPIPDRPLSISWFDIGVSANSGLPVTLASQTPAVCTLSGRTITLVSSGICSVIASQPGGMGYDPAQDIARSFSVLPATPNDQPVVTLISSKSPASRNESFTLTATVIGSTPPGTVSFHAYTANGQTTPVCANVPLGTQIGTGTAARSQANCVVPGSMSTYTNVTYWAIFTDNLGRQVGSAILMQQTLYGNAAISFFITPIKPTAAQSIVATAVVNGGMQSGNVSFYGNGSAPIANCSTQPIAPLPGHSITSGLAVATCVVPPGTLTAGTRTFGVIVSQGTTLNVASAVSPLTIADANSGPVTDYSDLWWAGSGENGWGMSINQRGSVQFNTLYIYDAAGKPVWLVMPGGAWNATYDTYSGPLYQPKGSPFANYNPNSLLVGPSVGNATLRFTAPDSAVLTYTLNSPAGSGSGTKNLIRQPFGASDTAPRFSVNGLWWNKDENGWGIAINQQFRTLFATWYTYADDGSTKWLVMPGGTWNGNIFTGDLYTTSGPPWVGTVFNPLAVAVNKVGKLSFYFIDPDAAMMSYTVNGISQSKIITRQPY